MKGNLILLSSEYIYPEVDEKFQLFACEKKFPILTDPNIPREIFILEENGDVEELKRISKGKNIYFYSLCQMGEKYRSYFLYKLDDGVLYSVVDKIITHHNDSVSASFQRNAYFSSITYYRSVLIEELDMIEEYKENN